MEQLNRELGKWYLRLAGPTCNHVRCRAIRQHGLDLIGRAVSEREFQTTDPERMGMAFAEPIPSVRKDISSAPAVVRSDARGKKHLVGSYGTKKTNDLGDYELLRKPADAIRVAETSPADPKDPRWIALNKEWKATAGKGEEDRKSTRLNSSH